MSRTWTAVLARLGVPTGDGRIIDPAGISSRDLPMPLMWQEKTADGHDGAVTVGSIDSIQFTNGMVVGEGRLLELFPERERLMELINAGVVGPSVDLADDLEYSMDAAERVVITRASIGGATLVPIEAFADVSIHMTDRSDDYPDEDSFPAYAFALGTFSVRSSGWSDMPIADAGRDWDGSAAANRVFAWATDGDTTDWGKYARAFLRKDDSANPETRGAYGFGIADVIGGTLTIVPRGVFAAAAAVQGARTGSAPEDAEGMKRVLRGIYARMDRPAPFSLAASAATAVLPPVDWFRRPDLDRLTPLTVSDTGRVFGHIAPWGQCHIGLPGCVTAPYSASGYAYFHTGEQATAEGAVLPVGTLVAGPRHADLNAAFQAAQMHYDDPRAAVAKVMAGEDEFGIWVAGWMLPGATPEAVDTFRSSPVSGDWRRIGGSLEMIAVCSVNAPGFPVPRARVAFSSGQQGALIGSFGITPVAGEPIEVQTGTAFVKETDHETARAKWRWAQLTGMED